MGSGSISSRSRLTPPIRTLSISAAAPPSRSATTAVAPSRRSTLPSRRRSGGPTDSGPTSPVPGRSSPCLPAAACSQAASNRSRRKRAAGLASFPLAHPPFQSPSNHGLFNRRRMPDEVPPSDRPAPRDAGVRRYRGAGRCPALPDLRSRQADQHQHLHQLSVRPELLGERQQRLHQARDEELRPLVLRGGVQRHPPLLGIPGGRRG